MLHELMLEIDTCQDMPNEYAKGQRVHMVLFALTLYMIYMMTNYPDDYFYRRYALLAPIMLGLRVHFFYGKNQLFYFVDICYIAGVLVWLFIVFFPKSWLLY